MHIAVSQLDYFTTSSAVFRTKLHLPSDKFPWTTPKGNLCIQNPLLWTAVDAKRQELKNGNVDNDEDDNNNDIQ